jgi:hypothetical protein
MLASQQPDGGISPEDAYRAHLRVGDEIHALEELGMSAASISDLGYPDPEAFIPDPEVPSDEGRERAATLSRRSGQARDRQRETVDRFRAA